MVDQGKNVLELPVKTTANNAIDRVLFIYAAANSSAQTASITIQNLLKNVAIGDAVDNLPAATPDMDMTEVSNYLNAIIAALVEFGVMKSS